MGEIVELEELCSSPLRRLSVAMATVVRANSNSTETGPADAPAPKPGRILRIKLALFLSSLLVSVSAFVTIDYFYSKAILGSVVAGGAHGFCFSRDPVRAFG